jgi:hypothetical protein
LPKVFCLFSLLTNQTQTSDEKKIEFFNWTYILGIEAISIERLAVNKRLKNLSFSII